MKKIICYGDSNTYGYMPYHERYDIAYPEVLENLLGKEYKVYNEGLNGRTSIYKAKFPERVGISNVEDILLPYKHIDYFIFMLGTNDLKHGNADTVEDIYNGLNQLLSKITKLNIIDHMIFVSPILLGKDIGDTDIEFDYHSYELSLHLYEVYRRLTEKYKPDVLLDAKEYISPTFDNAHFKREGHITLATILKEEIEGLEN